MTRDSAIGAIDVGGTKIAVGLVDEQGHILACTQSPTCPEAGYPAALDRIRSMLHGLLRDCGRSVKGIGIGSTGPIDPITGIYGDVGTLPGWKGSPLGPDLEREFGVRVRVENDADAAALAEAVWGAGRGSRNVLYVTISTGIGVGIVLDGMLYRGVGGAHPEIGHHIVDASGPACYCGANGCWEALASGPAMEAWMRTNGTAHTAQRICELARQGDPQCMEAVRREAHYLGLGLANLVTIFCPDVIVLGGGVMRSADLLLPRAIEQVRAICTQVPAEKTSHGLACLGQDTGLLGAACAWLRREEDAA